MTYRVLVCGGRNFNDAEFLENVLNGLAPTPTMIISGGATGADNLADHWAEHHGLERRRFFADWNRYGRAAGPIRNKQMLVEGRPHLVVAFEGGRGTANMIATAKYHGVEVIEITHRERTAI